MLDLHSKPYSTAKLTWVVFVWSHGQGLVGGDQLAREGAISAPACISYMQAAAVSRNSNADSLVASQSTNKEFKARWCGQANDMHAVWLCERDAGGGKRRVEKGSEPHRLARYPWYYPIESWFVSKVAGKDSLEGIPQMRHVHPTAQLLMSSDPRLLSKESQSLSVLLLEVCELYLGLLVRGSYQRCPHL